MPGYIKRPDKTVSEMLFVWNVLRLDSVWVQIDASMHHGYLNENYKFVRYPTKDYFCAPSSVFIKHHFPHDPMWQLLINPYNKLEFILDNYQVDNKLPYSFRDSLNIYMKKK